MYKTYLALAPKPDEFGRLLDTLGAYMKQKYDWSSEVAKLKLPIMLVYGDGDPAPGLHDITTVESVTVAVNPTGAGGGAAAVIDASMPTTTSAVPHAGRAQPDTPRRLRKTRIGERVSKVRASWRRRRWARGRVQS